MVLKTNNAEGTTIHVSKNVAKKLKVKKANEDYKTMNDLIINLLKENKNESK